MPCHDSPSNKLHLELYRIHVLLQAKVQATWRSLLLEVLGESTDYLQAAIKKFITFHFIHLGDKFSKSIEHRVVHEIFVGVETYAVDLMLEKA